MEAARATRNLLLTLSGTPSLFDDFLVKLRLFRSSTKFNLRQTFLYQCSSLLHPSSEHLFLGHFLGDFISLANDKVVNVRMSLAEVLSQHSKHAKHGGDKSLITRCKGLAELVGALQGDKSRDVRELVAAIEVREVGELVEEEAKRETTDEEAKVDVA